MAPSRIDVPIEGDGLTEAECYALLEGLGLVAGNPPRAIEPEAVELVLTLDEEDRRELDRIRAARDPGPAATPTDAMPSLQTAFGGGDIGRNDPCPAAPARSSSAATAAETGNPATFQPPRHAGALGSGADVLVPTPECSQVDPGGTQAMGAPSRPRGVAPVNPPALSGDQ